MTDGDKPRCPQCLRQHGLRPIEQVAAKRQGQRGSTGKASGWIVALVLVAGAGGYFAWQRSRGQASQLDAESLRDRAQKTAGIDVGDAADLLKADDAIESFAERATRGKSTPDDKAKAIVQAIQARAKAQAFVPWSLNEPREAPARTAAQTLQALAKDGAREQLYPLEVAALGVSALRSVDVPAQLVEVYAFAQERAPLDASGRLGYYAVGVGSHVYDVYGGRSQPPAANDLAAISDEQGLARLLALRGLARLVHAQDPAGALQLVDAASKLAPSSAAVRGARAAVLLATGGKDEGSRELEAAAQLRSGPAQNNNLAMYALATGEVDRAAKLVAAALSAAPDFAAGHLTLASIHLARVERDDARAELTQAERLDPGLPALPMAWAELYAGSGDLMQAEAKAREAVRMRPKSPETHLLLARLHRQAGRYDAMRQEARQVLELAPASQKDQISQVLKAVLGPTALEVSDTPEDSDIGAAAPSQEPGSLQLRSGEPKLRLGGGSKLKLDLTK
ncbi:MAG TPA: tetratricopeptide repeat protein [Polyangiales bacterium]|nr:tetratricopeptide repeat protein [Polyangiales bacterium]